MRSSSLYPAPGLTRTRIGQGGYDMHRPTTSRDRALAPISVALVAVAASMAAAPVAAREDPGPAGQSALTSLGAEHQTFADTFDAPGAWGTVDDEVTRIAYEDGALVMVHRKERTARTTTVRPAQASPALRLEVDVEIGADGSSAGPMCGSAVRSDHSFGVVSTADTWVVGRMLDGNVSVLGSGPIAGTDVAVGTPVHLAIECAATDGGDRVALWVDGTLVADIAGTEPRGPYDRVGVYSDALTGGSTVRFDDAVAFDGGPVPGLTTLGAGDELLGDDTFLPGPWTGAEDGSLSLAFEDGAMAATVEGGGGVRLMNRRTPYASRELRTELDVTLGDAGSRAGPLCISADATPDVVYAVVDSASDWSVGRIAGGVLGTLARGHLDDLEVAPGAPVRVALECALTDEGDRMALWVGDRLVADVTSTQRHGPYDQVGLYAQAEAAGTTVRFDDAVVRAGDPVSTLSSLGARDLVLEDDFGGKARWTTGKARQGKVAYDEGRLRFSLRRPEGALWSWVVLAGAVPVIRSEGIVDLGGGQGDAGFLCGAPGDDAPFHYAGLRSGGEVVLGTAAASTMTQLVRVPLPPGVTPSAAHHLVLECAVAGSGGDRVAVWVDGVLAIDHVLEASLGALDRTAVYGHAVGRRFSAAFDDVRILEGQGYSPVGDRPPVTGG